MGETSEKILGLGGASCPYNGLNFIMLDDLRQLGWHRALDPALRQPSQGGIMIRIFMRDQAVISYKCIVMFTLRPSCLKK
jgi:hypothetical protein